MLLSDQSVNVFICINIPQNKHKNVSNLYKTFFFNDRRICGCCLSVRDVMGRNGTLLVFNLGDAFPR